MRVSPILFVSPVDVVSRVRARTAACWCVLAAIGLAGMSTACEPKDSGENLWTDQEKRATPAPEQPAAAPAEAPTDNSSPSTPPPRLPAVVPVNPTGRVDMADGRLMTLADLVEKLRPSVVNIYTTNIAPTQSGRQQFQPFKDFDLYGIPSDRAMQALGTGFLISIDGYILTNNHVIEGASRIKVRLFDETESTAEIVGADPKTDIALIKIPPQANLTPLPLGDSADLRVGDWVVAIGNPLGLTHTVTSGIVSARGRTNVPLSGKITYMDFIQTDASINPGNSGGPLINLTGECVGINTAISRQGQGIGFAIPVNMAKDILPQLMTTGRVVRSFIGIFPKPVPPEVAQAAGLDPSTGALVDRVVPGGPAHQAGVRQDDIVISFDGQPIKEAKELRWLAQTAGVGRIVPLEVVRGGERLELRIVTEEMPE